MVLCLCVEGWLCLCPSDALLGLHQISYFLSHCLCRKVVLNVGSCLLTIVSGQERRVLVLILHVLAVPLPNYVDVHEVLTLCILCCLSAKELPLLLSHVKIALDLLPRQSCHGRFRRCEADLTVIL